ncbi:hypothetical protein BSKO_12639 [Bryopsis sp. KO-2023]|nr:hypothetical protein BSKO_12639 [Bryopsis sp. KO-2023]
MKISDKSAFVRSAGNGVLTIQCQYEVQEEKANAWAKAVFSKLEPKRVLVVGKLKISGIPGYALVDFESPVGPSSKSIRRLASALSEICVPMGAKIQPVGKEHILPSVARAKGPLFV